MQKGHRYKLDSISVLKVLSQSDSDPMSLCPRPTALEEIEASEGPDGEALCGIKRHRPHNNRSSLCAEPTVLFFLKYLLKKGKLKCFSNRFDLGTSFTEVKLRF